MRGALAALLILLWQTSSPVWGVDGGGEIVLAAAETPMRQYMEDGKPTGYVLDILIEAFQRTGHPLKIRFMPWARCLVEARTGAVDGVIGATHTADREGDFLFSEEPLMQETKSAFARIGDSKKYVPTLEGLAEIRLGIINGTTSGEAFDRALASGQLRHVEKASNFDSLLHMLSGHRVDVILADRLSILGASKKDGTQDEFRELSPPVLQAPLYIAFTRARDMSEINRDFSAALRDMKHDGTYFGVFLKYFR